MSECIHGGLPEICPPCQGTPTAPPAVERSHPFTAKYDGRCAGCGFDIYPGQRIARQARDDRQAEFCHVDCIGDTP